jgi:hypothetical protein
MSEHDDLLKKSDAVFMEREQVLKEKELALREKEIEAKIKLEKRGLWFASPLLIGAITAISGLIGTGVGAVLQGYSNSTLERQKFEFTLIQTALKAPTQNEQAKQLLFLINSGVIISLDGSKLRNIAEKNPSQLPGLVTVVPNARVFLLAGTDGKTKMFNNFQSELVKAGFNVLGAKQIEDDSRPTEPEVRYFSPSDKQQADIVVKFVRSRLSNQAIPAKYYNDPSAKPGYVEIWLGR